MYTGYEHVTLLPVLSSLMTSQSNYVHIKLRHCYIHVPFPSLPSTPLLHVVEHAKLTLHYTYLKLIKFTQQCNTIHIWRWQICPQACMPTFACTCTCVQCSTQQAVDEVVPEKCNAPLLFPTRKHSLHSTYQSTHGSCSCAVAVSTQSTTCWERGQ